MTCTSDEQCASSCCGQMHGDSTKTCHALIENQFCPRAVAPKVDYSKYKDEDGRRKNDLLGSDQIDSPTYRGQDGCKVHGADDQCDGQPCVQDSDCHNGCCGHFVSFSLKRCLPLTDDSLCARILEPSYTSPVPARLPAIESTIRDIYSI